MAGLTASPVKLAMSIAATSKASVLFNQSSPFCLSSILAFQNGRDAMNMTWVGSEILNGQTSKPIIKVPAISNPSRSHNQIHLLTGSLLVLRYSWTSIPSLPSMNRILS